MFVGVQICTALRHIDRSVPARRPALPQLLTGPGGGAIIGEYEELLDALLKRSMDAEVCMGCKGCLS